MRLRDKIVSCWLAYRYRRIGWRARISQALSIAVCVPTLLGYAQTARQIAGNTFPSVVLLVMQDANGQTLSLGSGFFVESDVVATNLHVIEKARKGYAKIIGENRKFDVVGCVGVDIRRDLALLKLGGANAPGLRLADSAEVAIGDEVYVVGNPRGLEGTFSSGIVSGIRRLGGDTLLQITAPISPGSSGGPVLDSLGRVIGIASGTFKMGENLNFAIPAGYLTLLLQSKKPIKPLPVLSVSGEKRTILDFRPEGVVGTHFRWGLELEYGPAVLLKEIEFTFSVRNQLAEPIKNVSYLIIFYDPNNKPVDVYDGFVVDTIPSGLAKRESHSVNRSVRQLTARVEIRILDFKFVQ